MRGCFKIINEVFIMDCQNCIELSFLAGILVIMFFVSACFDGYEYRKLRNERDDLKMKLISQESKGDKK